MLWREVTTEVSNSLIMSMKGMERVIEKNHQGKESLSMTCNLVFMPGRGTTDAIFILRTVTGKNILLRTRNCTSHLLTLKRRSIAYQEKSSGGPCEKLGIEEWIVRFVQAMYNNTRSRVRVNNTYSDEFWSKSWSSPGFDT